MNFGLTYLQGKIKSATNSWNSALQEDNGAILIRKANKINTVLDMMSFCQSECDLKFSDSSSEQKSVINENNYSESKEEFCFQSCTAKTFEVKQIESFMYDKYCNNSDIE